MITKEIFIINLNTFLYLLENRDLVAWARRMWIHNGGTGHIMEKKLKIKNGSQILTWTKA